jgi:hypothetical protein
VFPPRVLRLPASALLLTLASCTAGKHPSPVARIPIAAAPAVVPQETAPVPEHPRRAPLSFRTSANGISISGISYDSRSHLIAVADQEGGPGSKWADASEAAKAYRGIAAINGGFFTPEGKPLGLVVSSGKKTGSINRASSLGAGMFSGENTPALIRRDGARASSEILQTGPFLVESGQATGGLSAKSSTARSFIAWDGASGWILARTGPCSLAELATSLAGAEIGGVKIKSALNLDGGRSSDLWISSAVQGGPLHERPLWNKPVRNFLVLVPRN